MTRETIRYAIAATSPIGPVLVAVSARGLCAVELGAEPSELRDALAAFAPDAQLVEDASGLATVLDGVLSLINGPAEKPAVPLDLRGTEFQLRVWEALCEIPWGQTRSYGEIAARIGRPSAARAVASACRANPVGVIVPCHRVVHADGTLSGYRGGVEHKRTLLRMEGVRVE